MKITKAGIFDRRQGSILIVAVITILFISGVVIGLMYWLWSETKQTTQKKLSAKAVYMAETGVQVAVQRLQKGGIIGGSDYNRFIQLLPSPSDTTDFYSQIDGNQVHVTIEEIQ